MCCWHLPNSTSWNLSCFSGQTLSRFWTGIFWTWGWAPYSYSRKLIAQSRPWSSSSAFPAEGSRAAASRGSRSYQRWLVTWWIGLWTSRRLAAVLLRRKCPRILASQVPLRRPLPLLDYSWILLRPLIFPRLKKMSLTYLIYFSWENSMVACLATWLRGATSRFKVEEPNQNLAGILQEVKYSRLTN